MSDISLLDCTLRDGGYLNDWRFEHKNIKNIFYSLVNAGVDVIEVGFLDERRPFDFDRTIFPNCISLNKIFSSFDKKNSKVVAMIDYGTCGIENILPRNESFIDGIRVIFKKDKAKNALEFCSSLKKLGYEVYAQLVSITSYSENELKDVVEFANTIKPYALSIVDTYGLLDSEKLYEYFNIIESNLDKDINIGFHAHNNLQLAYSNCISFMSYESTHKRIVDATLFGMGKSAGNAPIELVAKTLNEKYKKDYDINSFLTAIDESVKDFYLNNSWGYNTFFYISSFNNCHPSYVKDVFNSDLSIKDINTILGSTIPKEKKLLYDKDFSLHNIEDYNLLNMDNSSHIEEFVKTVNNSSILILGPGKNIILEKSKIDEFVKLKNPIVISINYIPAGFDVNYVFLTNSKRYVELCDNLLNQQNIKFIATSNLSQKDNNFYIRIPRRPLLENNEKINDNSFLMLLRFLKKIGVKSVFCAGLDGYSETDSNYCVETMEYTFIKREANYLNYHISRVVDEFRKYMDINFITYSIYDNYNNNDEFS